MAITGFSFRSLPTTEHFPEYNGHPKMLIQSTTGLEAIKEKNILGDYWARYRKANKTASILSTCVFLFVIEPSRRSAVIGPKLDLITFLGWFFRLLPPLLVHKLSQVVVILYYPFWIILGSIYPLNCPFAPPPMHYLLHLKAQSAFKYSWVTECALTLSGTLWAPPSFVFPLQCLEQGLPQGSGWWQLHTRIHQR